MRRPRSTVRRALCATALGASLMFARNATAAPPSREADAAKQWFAHGVAAARTGDLPAARKAFGAAYALVPSVDILWNLAMTERKLGDTVAALDHFRTYVASPDARADRKKLAQEEALPELEAATAHLAFAEPEGAIAVVDGKQASTATTLDVAPGVHSVIIRHEGVDRTLAVEAVAGVVTRIPSAAPAAAPAPAPAVVAAPAPAAAPVVGLVQSPPASNRTTAVLALGGAAVLSIAAGVYFSFQAHADQETSDRLQTRMRNDDLSCKHSGSLCDDYESARSSAQRNSLLGSGLLVGGGVLGGAAVAALVLWPSSTTRVAPIAGRDTAGVSVAGRF